MHGQELQWCGCGIVVHTFPALGFVCTKSPFSQPPDPSAAAQEALEEKDGRIIGHYGSR